MVIVASTYSRLYIEVGVGAFLPTLTQPKFLPPPQPCYEVSHTNSFKVKRGSYLKCEAEMRLSANVEMKNGYRNIRQLYVRSSCNDSDKILSYLEYGIVHDAGQCHG
jgi:hypothetical protein